MDLMGLGCEDVGWI